MDLTALINTYRGPLIGLIASWHAFADTHRFVGPPVDDERLHGEPASRTDRPLVAVFPADTAPNRCRHLSECGCPGTPNPTRK